MLEVKDIAEAGDDYFVTVGVRAGIAQIEEVLKSAKNIEKAVAGATKNTWKQHAKEFKATQEKLDTGHEAIAKHLEVVRKRKRRSRNSRSLPTARVSTVNKKNQKRS